MAKRYSEEQIVAVFKEAESGMKTLDICRKHGISDATVYKWNAKYAGLEVSDLRKIKALEEENSRLKQIVADLSLDNRALKDVLSNKF